jgi:hypothetical protein
MTLVFKVIGSKMAVFNCPIVADVTDKLLIDAFDAFIFVPKEPTLLVNPIPPRGT